MAQGGGMNVYPGQLRGFVCNESSIAAVFRRSGDGGGAAAAGSATRTGNDIPVARSRQGKWRSAEVETGCCHDVSCIGGRVVVLSNVSMVTICPW